MRALRIGDARPYLNGPDVTIEVARYGAEHYAVETRVAGTAQRIEEHCSAATTLGVADAIARGYRDMYLIDMWRLPATSIFISHQPPPRDVVQ